MDSNNTLGRFFGGSKAQSQGSQSSLIDVTALQSYYLNLVNGQLYYRLPVVGELSTIDTNVIQNMSRLCAAVTPTVHETWEEFQAQISAEGAAGAQHSFIRRKAA